MKLAITFTIFIFAIAAKQLHKHNVEEEKHAILSDLCSNPSVMPQVDTIGTTMDLLSLKKFENIFSFNCFQRSFSVDGNFQLPDGIKYKPILEMSQQNVTNTAQNRDELMDIKFQILRTLVGDEENQQKLQRVAGALNPNLTKIEENINHDNVVFQKLTTMYTGQYAYIDDYSQFTLTDKISKAIENLPEQYDYKAYLEFINTFGTHYRRSLQIGGIIEQNGYTNRTYTQYHSMDDIKTNFLYNFAQEELSRQLSVNHIPTSLLDKHPDQDYLDDTQFGDFFVKGGNYKELTGWIATLEASPVMVRQTIVNMTNIMIPTFFPNMKKLQAVKQNTDKALKKYLIDSQGCTNKDAINYDKTALVNDNSCFYTVFDGSYQTANSDQCTQDFQDKYQLLNPGTKDITCKSDTVSKKIASYHISGCNVEQYFCVRDDPSSSTYPDLYESLFFCERRNLTNVFYENDQQYLCDTNKQKENKLQFYIKDSETREISTCLSNFCFSDNQFGTQFFINRHVGTCTGYNIESSLEKAFAQCASGCLVEYGLVKIADDCDLQQFVCINQQRNLVCYNN